MGKDIMPDKKEVKEDFQDKERVVEFGSTGFGSYQLNKPLPGATVRLPSLGRIYNYSTPIPPEIKIKAMGMRQLMIINTPALWANDDAFPMVVRDCVYGLPQGIDVLDLHPDDRDAVLIALRILSFGRKYKVPVQCTKPTCQHIYPHTVDLEKDFPVDHLSEEKYPQVQVPYIIPKDKEKWLWDDRSVSVRPLNWREELELDRREELRKKRLEKENLNDQVKESYMINERIIDELEYGIVDVEGLGTSKAAIREWLLELSAHDASILLQMMNYYRFGVRTSFEPAPCPVCGNKFNTSLPISFDFFRSPLPET